MSDCRFGVSPVNYPDPDPEPLNCPSIYYFGLESFLVFCLILMIFLPKCRALYFLSEKKAWCWEKGYGARIKGHGMAPRYNAVGNTNTLQCLEPTLQWI